MTIDEAIAKYNKLANNDRTCYPEEAQQLAEWLEELKALREKNETLKALYEDARKEGNNLLKCERNKAIDDFASKLKAKCDGMIKDKWNSNVAPISWAEAYADFKDDIEEIAEQLKVGVNKDLER